MADILLTLSGTGSYDVRTLLSPTEQNNPISLGSKDITFVAWRPYFDAISYDSVLTMFSRGNPNEYRLGRLWVEYFGAVTDKFYLNFENQIGRMRIMFSRLYYDEVDTGATLSFGLFWEAENLGDTLRWDLPPGVSVQCRIVALQSALYYSVGAWL